MMRINRKAFNRGLVLERARSRIALCLIALARAATPFGWTDDHLASAEDAERSWRYWDQQPPGGLFE